jgi:molybdopterin-guanine dinucleotide biosynthesis protein A
MEPVSVFILAGGKSTRMGSDKAFLELAGKPLIAHSLQLARTVSSDVKVVGDPDKFAAFGPVVSDLYLNCGPLGGIHAALAASSTDWNLILGVDLPFIKAEFLKYLVSEAQSSGAVVTVPSTSHYFEPLCAVYRAAFRASAERALSAGKHKIDALFSEVPLRVITEEEMTRAGFISAIFRNLNTQDDWTRAKQEFASQ